MKSSASFNRKLLSTLIAASLTTGVYAQDQGLEEVVVTGIRASLTNSVNVKRTSGSVVDAISAEDIGKLPDTTIADSLQRIPGIQIRRSAGEGAQVNVRGMPQVSTLLNGEQFLSAGSITTSQPELTDIPAELLSRVDVMKSSEAKTLAAGVAGTIDLKTRRPFDMEQGWTFAGSAEGSQGSYTDDETGHKVAGFAGFNNGDNFGAIVTVTNSKATMANYRYGMYSEGWYRGYHENVERDPVTGSDKYWPGYATPTDLTNDGDTNDVLFGTIDYGATNKTTERERTGISGSVQFQATDSIELLADVFYTKMDQGDYVNGLIADNAWSSYDWISPNPSANVVNRGKAVGGNGKDFYTTSITDLDAVRVLAKSETQMSERESLNFNLQANLELTDKLSGSVRYIHGNATNDATRNFADAFITSGAQHGLSTNVGGVKAPVNPGGYGPDRVPVVADFSGKHPSFAYPEGFGQDINGYGLVSSFADQNRDEESTLDVFRIDGTYDFQDGVKLDFGYRFADREVVRDQYDYVAPFVVKDANGNDVTVYSKWRDSGLEGVKGGETIAQTFSFTDLQDMGLITSISDFGPASDGNSYYFIDTNAMKNNLAFQEKLYPGNVRVKDGAESYIVEDKTQTFYVQASFEGEAGLPYQANVGLQYIETDLSITKYERDFTYTTVVDGVTYPTLDGTPRTITGTDVIERGFNDFLPRMNIAFDTSDNTKLRLAYTKTMQQMDANLLGRGRIFTTNYDSTNNVFKSVSASEYGNPYMNPWRSENYDASFEWYFSDSGMVSVGAFRVDLETGIATRGTKIDAVPDSDGVLRNTNQIDLTVTENTEGNVMKGWEVAYQQGFDFLPGAWSGLGTTLNYTYTTGEGSQKDFYGETMPVQDNSKHQVNAVLWYEYDQWQARVAYNYRSERFMSRQWIDGNPSAMWSAPTAYVDASVSYDINDNVTVYLQGTNLTEEYEESYMQWTDVVVDQNIYEARYTLGVRAKF
ncbi:TonB-dependent receptor [Cellvibrio mixtus]|uniref:TonB-dependent receptor n=1 Tax=Cellvibrio mixtus TaxID=39650 RepID=A0A266QCN0_9GAMM|nr:TonB-dependent receptor [Cellvibrio mixtus]OZY87664.1 TonB-dependent receptor [Cellvibrio mixtus]